MSKNKKDSFHKKENDNIDILIIGGGMVGLSLAYQISKRYKDLKIHILDKEKQLGLHNSGRNSGVLHAGIYYKPDSLRAKVCVDGAKRLRKWCMSEDINVLNCGKLIVTQNKNQSNELDLLFKRAKRNGAYVKLIGKEEVEKHSPFIYTATEKSIWSPNTCVVDPKLVLKRLEERVKKMGVKIICGTKILQVNTVKNTISYAQKNGVTIFCEYGHLFNCCGVNSDYIARKFELGERYKILPFKGIYWKLKSNNKYSFKTNIYPIPDLNLPFLGVHITPDLNGDIFLGPTAIPALGKENYYGFDGIEPFLAANFLSELTIQFFKNKGGFRQYAYDQALHGIKPFFLRAAKKIIPSLKNEDLIKSKKVGIRAQLFDIKKRELIDDFKLIKDKNSTHVLNAISPAFTASFALADLIINESKVLD